MKINIFKKLICLSILTNNNSYLIVLFRESTLLDLKKDPSKPATLPEAATQPVTAGSTTSNDPHVFLPPSSTNKLGAMMQSSSKSGTKAVKLLSSTNSTKVNFVDTLRFSISVQLYKKNSKISGLFRHHFHRCSSLIYQ